MWARVPALVCCIWVSMHTSPCVQCRLDVVVVARLCCCLLHLLVGGELGSLLLLADELLHAAQVVVVLALLVRMPVVGVSVGQACVAARRGSVSSRRAGWRRRGPRLLPQWSRRLAASVDADSTPSTTTSRRPSLPSRARRSIPISSSTSLPSPSPPFAQPTNLSSSHFHVR